MRGSVDKASELPFRVDFRHDQNRLRAEVIGRTGNLENSLAFWEIVAGEALRLNVTTLLVVDAAAGEPLEMGQLQKLVHSVSKLGLGELRIAFVETINARIRHDEAAEILGRELGYVVRIFSQEAEAALWLRYGES